MLAIERDLTQPDRMVGEVLQPGGYLKLVELGLEGEYVNPFIIFYSPHEEKIIENQYQNLHNLFLELSLL